MNSCKFSVPLPTSAPRPSNRFSERSECNAPTVGFTPLPLTTDVQTKSFTKRVLISSHLAKAVCTLLILGKEWIMAQFSYWIDVLSVSCHGQARPPATNTTQTAPLFQHQSHECCRFWRIQFTYLASCKTSPFTVLRKKEICRQLKAIRCTEWVIKYSLISASLFRLCNQKKNGKGHSSVFQRILPCVLPWWTLKVPTATLK